MIAATTLTSLELRLLGGTDVSAPVMKSSSSALGANAFQDTDVALAPLRDAPHQSNDPTVRRKDAGFWLLTYRGRTTGRIYHLPINVFKRGEHYIFVLTYGSESQWVKNVLASGACEIQAPHRSARLSPPHPT